MIYCTECGHELENKDIFCSSCGYNIKSKNSMLDINLEIKKDSKSNLKKILGGLFFLLIVGIGGFKYNETLENEKVQIKLESDIKQLENRIKKETDSCVTQELQSLRAQFRMIINHSGTREQIWGLVQSACDLSYLEVEQYKNKMR